MAELLCDLVLVTRSDVISPVPDLRSEVTRHEWINNDALTSSFVSFMRDWSCTFQSLQTLLVSLVSILCTHNSFQVLVSLKNVKPPRFARRESWQVQVRHRSRWDLHRRLLRMSQRRSKSDEAAVSWSCISWCTKGRNKTDSRTGKSVSLSLSYKKARNITTWINSAISIGTS